MELSTTSPGNIIGTPLYRITVWLDCFNPTSCITTIAYLRGGEHKIGSFEMGDSQRGGFLRFGEMSYPLDSVFEDFRKKVKVHAEMGERWTWNRPGCPASFEWDCRYPDGEAVCRESSTKKEFARLTFPTPLTEPTPGERNRTLRIYDRARRPNRDLSHDILISALIVERKRLAPAVGKEKHGLFNF